jgi:hypothetical protein
MSNDERARLLSHLQVAVDASLKLVGLPLSSAWGTLSIRIEDGKVVTPTEVRLTFK